MGVESGVSMNRLDSRKSPSTTSRLDGAARRSVATRSRSISKAVTRAERAVSGPVSAPRPGPISKKLSSGRGAIASTTLITQAGSRKCWPKRLRAAIPVLLFDRLDFVLAQSEVVADLVNQRLADRDDKIFLVVRLAFERALKKQNAVRQRVPVVPAALGERRALIQAQ